MASARLLAAQGMVREGFMTGACRHGPVSGWPSPSSSADPATASSVKKVCTLASFMPMCHVSRTQCSVACAASLLQTKSCQRYAAICLLLICHALTCCTILTEYNPGL